MLCVQGAGSSIGPLSWGTRLKIMVDAAQGKHTLHTNYYVCSKLAPLYIKQLLYGIVGLEYLHHGCNPPIIRPSIMITILLQCGKSLSLQ